VPLLDSLQRSRRPLGDIGACPPGLRPAFKPARKDLRFKRMGLRALDRAIHPTDRHVALVICREVAQEGWPVLVVEKRRAQVYLDRLAPLAGSTARGVFLRVPQNESLLYVPFLTSERPRVS
jgi:hypothetical protein